MALNIQSPPWEFRSVEAGEEAHSLVNTVVEMGNAKGWPFFAFYSDDVLNLENESEQEDEDPDETTHELRISVDPRSGYGALHWFCFGDPDSPYVSQTQDTPPELELVYDGSTGEPFPMTALVPLSTVRAALLELSMSRKRPECVIWQEFDRL